MPRLRLALLIALFAVSSSRADGPVPEIIDPQWDAYAERSSVRAPHPAVDILSVDIDSTPTDITFRITVQDMDYAPLGVHHAERQFVVAFGAPHHELVLLFASERTDGSWRADLYCFDQDVPTCFKTAPPPVADVQTNSLTLRAQREIVGSEIFHPSAGSSVRYVKNMVLPGAALGDIAPNSGFGASYEAP